jgi:mRNA interferase MazF
MPSFNQGDIVRVPFPYTDNPTRQTRPALVVSDGAIGDKKRLLWVVMITSADNRPWLGDVPVGAIFEEVGLPIPSTVRPSKIATIEATHAERIGHLPAELLADVMRSVGVSLGL